MKIAEKHSAPKMVEELGSPCSITTWRARGRFGEFVPVLALPNLALGKTLLREIKEAF